MSVELGSRSRSSEARTSPNAIRRLLGPFTGNEAALDAGCGTGSVAFALAPHVAEVVGVDTRAEYLEAARAAAPTNVRFQEADVMSLPFGYAEFELVCCHRVLHHVRRPSSRSPSWRASRDQAARFSSPTSSARSTRS